MPLTTNNQTKPDKQKLAPSSKRALKILAIFIVLMASLLVIYDEFRFQSGYDDDYLEEDLYQAEEELFFVGDCNVAGIELHGELVTYISPNNTDEDGYPTADQVASENITYAIEEAEKDDKIKAIILEVDSLGGALVADEEVADALKRAHKPTVSLIRSYALSAAYYAATGADQIFASVDSDIGSIGVSMSYLDQSKQNEKEGLSYNQLSLGKFKDAGDPDKSLTLEERELFMRDLEIINENFIKAVAENRGLEIEKVRQLADGSSMLGQMALANGLIDQIGGMFEVKEYLKNIIGEDVEICW